MWSKVFPNKYFMDTINCREKRLEPMVMESKYLKIPYKGIFYESY